LFRAQRSGAFGSRTTPLLADAAGPCRHAIGDRWFVDETYVKVAGTWRYVYRAVDQSGQIIDVYVSAKRDFLTARRFFATALRAHGEPVEVVTDRAPALRAAIEGPIPAAFHNSEQYANNRIESDHGRLKARLRPMRGLKRDHSARVILRGHALMQNIRRGHYELGVEPRPYRRIETAFTELARTI
jgi:transposase, IS6 family